MTEAEALTVRDTVSAIGMRAFLEHVVRDNPHGYQVRVTLPAGTQCILSTPERAEDFLRHQWEGS